MSTDDGLWKKVAVGGAAAVLLGLGCNYLSNRGYTRETENGKLRIATVGQNGKGYVLKDRAGALANYPHLREVNGFLYVSGTSSRRPDGKSHVGAVRVEDGSGTHHNGEWNLDIREQTQAVIENIEVILKEAGASLADLVSMSVFLVSFDDYKGMNEIYNNHFNAKTGPVRTTVAVARLPHPNLLIEIQAIAKKPEPWFKF